MLKILGALLIVGACSTLGVSAKHRIRQRMHALDAMIAALQFIVSELQCRMLPLPEIIQALANSTNHITKHVFVSLSQKMTENDDLSVPYKWCKTFRECQDYIGLGAEETQLICDISGFLGKYDVAQQVSNLKYVEQRLVNIRSIAQEEFHTKGNIYRSCGIAVGIITVLILL